METYLPRCLDSLLIPSIDSLDIVVVNDGSKDRSSEIAHSYAEKYPDSIRVIDKENGNYGSCINAALPTIKGRYVKILDADDTFNTHNLEKFLNILNSIDADLVITDYVTVNEQGEITKTVSYSTIPSMQILGADFLKLIPETSTATMHAYTYNAKVFEGLNYHQSEGISYTDTEWSFYPMFNCHSIFYANLVVYKYLVGREGQTMDLKIYIKRVNQMISIIDKIIDFYVSKIQDKNNPVKNFYNLLIYQLLKSLYMIVLYNKTDYYSEFLKLDSKISNIIPEIYSQLDRSTSFLNKFYPISYWKNHNKNYNAPLLKIYRSYLKFK